MAKGDQNRILADATTTHSIYIQRVGASNGNNVVRIIDGSENQTIKYIQKRLDTFGPLTPTATSTVKINTMERGVAKIRGTSIREAENYLTGELNELAQNEAVFTGKAVESVIDDFVAKAPSDLVLNSIVNNGVFSGRNNNEWFSNLGASDITRIMSNVRAGMAQGLTTAQIVQGLRGTAKANYMDGAFQITRNNANTIARTMTNGVANSARMATYTKNADVISGLTYSATLDGRTSAICQALDGTTWKFPEQAEQVKTPPLHPNCRSTLIPEVEGLEGLNGNRPSANSDFEADAERRYNEKQKGNDNPKRWNDLAPSTRQKKYYDEIKAFEKETGKKAFKKVHATTDYKTYFKNQPAQFQKDILGSTKYQLYKSGKYDLDKFVDFNSGKPFTIQALKAKDKKNVANAQKKARELR